MNRNNTSVKKRLMFVASNDYYFLTYNILFLLRELGCDNEDSPFIDHRKLAFLIDFVADERLAILLEKAIRTGVINNETDRELLSTAWSVGLVRVKQINRLLEALERKGLLGIKKDEKRVSTTVWYKNTPSLNQFLDKNEFYKERQNAELLRKTIKGLPRLTFDTLQEKMHSFNKGFRNANKLTEEIDRISEQIQAKELERRRGIDELRLFEEHRDRHRMELRNIEKIIISHETLSIFDINTCPSCFHSTEREENNCICGKPVDEYEYERFFYTTEEYTDILKSKQSAGRTIDIAIEATKNEIS